MSSFATKEDKCCLLNNPKCRCVAFSFFSMLPIYVSSTFPNAIMFQFFLPSWVDNIAIDANITMSRSIIIILKSDVDMDKTKTVISSSSCILPPQYDVALVSASTLLRNCPRVNISLSSKASKTLPSLLQTGNENQYWLFTIYLCQQSNKIRIGIHFPMFGNQTIKKYYTYQCKDMTTVNCWVQSFTIVNGKDDILDCRHHQMSMKVGI